MKISIRNFLGCKEADIELKRLTMLIGYNKQCKSSILRAVQFLATGTDVKKIGKYLLKNKEAEGSVTIESEKGVATLKIPGGEAEGEAVTVSTVAAGLESLVDIKKSEDRFKLLSKALKAVPTLKDLEVELKAKELTDADVANAWNAICNPETERVDWAAAHQKFYTERTEMTGRWKKITGKGGWGIPSGDEWSPEGFSRQEMLDVKYEKLAEEKAACEAKVTELTKVQAVSEHRIAELKMLADQRETMPMKLAMAKEEERTRQAIFSTAEKMRSAFEVACCHCGKNQLISDGKSLKPEEVSRPDIDVEKTYNEAKAALQAQQAKIVNLTAEAANVMRAVAELEKVKAGNPDLVIKARAELDAVNHKLASWENFNRASQLHEEIKKRCILIDATAPDGLPGKKLAKSIEKFNGLLASLCEIANWPVIKVQDDAGVTQDGEQKLYEYKSESEKVRIKVALQLAFALYDKSDLLVIDALEILDEEQTGGLEDLIYLLDSQEIPVLLAAKAKDPSFADFIEKEYGGKRYWVQDGWSYDINEDNTVGDQEVQQSIEHDDHEMALEGEKMTEAERQRAIFETLPPYVQDNRIREGYEPWAD